MCIARRRIYLRPHNILQTDNMTTTRATTTASNRDHVDIWRAAREGDVGKCQFLVEMKGFDPNGKVIQTCILFLCDDQVSVETYELEPTLSVRSSTTAAVNEVNATPLYYAALCGHLDVINYLLSVGAKADEGRQGSEMTFLYHSKYRVIPHSPGFPSISSFIHSKRYFHGRTLLLRSSQRQT